MVPIECQLWSGFEEGICRGKPYGEYALRLLCDIADIAQVAVGKGNTAG